MVHNYRFINRVTTLPEKSIIHMLNELDVAEPPLLLYNSKENFLQKSKKFENF